MDFDITPTPEDLAVLDGPMTLQSLLTADFVGCQNYIDRWIKAWLVSDEYDAKDIPLCVENSIRCSKSLQRAYTRELSKRVYWNDVDWVSKHLVFVMDKWNLWDAVDFQTVTESMFELLWAKQPIPHTLIPFVAYARRLWIWDKLIQEYGADTTLEDAIRISWAPGVERCLDYGADVKRKDYVRHCMCSPDIFRLITACGPPVTKEAYAEFGFQCLLGRVPDIPLVEEWFWIHGVKSIEDLHKIPVYRK